MEILFTVEKSRSNLEVNNLKARVKTVAGIFTLCIEVELAWGFVHRKTINLSSIKRISNNARKILGTVLDLLEIYELPVTWSFLGHILLDRCDRDADGVPHPEMPRPSYSWLKRDDWYAYDPCTDVQRDPAWYGKDIVDRIFQYLEESRMLHDVGCHSFSHQLFGDPGCGEELARAEIESCVELMKMQYGVTPRVFTFPRDYVGHVELLKEYGFMAFRGVPLKLYPCLELEGTISNRIKRDFSLFIQFLSYYFLFPPRVATIQEVVPGLWSIPGCLAYGRKPLISPRLAAFKAKQGIKKAIMEAKIFSLYTHLRSLAESESMFSNFEGILSYVCKKRKEGKLETKTLTQLVNEFSVTGDADICSHKYK